MALTLLKLQASCFLLSLLIPSYAGLTREIRVLRGPLTVMTDCEGLKVFCNSALPCLVGGSGAEAPILALEMLLKAAGRSELLRHVPLV